jgi:heavy metal sensor kinase
MQSIRRRLTIGYIAALALTVTMFGTILYLTRRQASIRDLDQRLDLAGDLASSYLRQRFREFTRLEEVVETSKFYIESIPQYVVLVRRDGRAVMVSDRAGRLDAAAFDRLLALAKAPVKARTTGTVTLGPGNTLRYLVLPMASVDPELGTMLVAESADEISFGPEALLRSMVVIAPVLLLVSIFVGYSLAGASLYPLESMVDELTAISDGRSLHRRLAVDPGATDEVARLAQAVNAMFARLEQSFASQQRFVADASHELKTPLMVLRAGVERALTSPRVPAESLQPLDESLEEINRMTELVDNLLTLARADEGRAPLAVEECDIRDLVSEAAETAQILAEVSEVTVRTRIPPRPVVVQADRSRIRQLLLNLVTNAVNYTPKGGEVGVELVDTESGIQLVVSDTGIGIAAGDLPHIFDRFWRADPARSRDGDRSGTGLGLAITKWIAEAHGGSIAVQSRPGRGTIFTVSLPRSAPTAAPAG